MNKIIKIMLLTCLSMAALSIQSFAASAFPSITLGNAVSTYKLTARVGDTSSQPRVVSKAGTSAWSTDIAQKQYNMYFDISDDYVYNENGNVNISITYFDEGTGCFRICYKDKHNSEAASEIVRLKDSGAWKTAILTLKSARMDNGINGADFKITVSENEMGISSSDVTVSRVSLVPLKFEFLQKTNYDALSGNSTTFFNCEYTNYDTEAVTAELYVKVTNRSGAEVWEYSENVLVNSNSTLFKRLMPENVSESGLYTIEGSLKAGRQIIDISEQFVNGKINDRLGVCTHFAQDNPNITTDDLYLARQAGFSWIRDECAWESVENRFGVKGQYSIPENVQNCVDFADANGINMLMILDYSNRLYCDNWNTLPSTDEQIRAYENYCAYIAKTFKDKVKYFEIWNEPNSPMYGGGNVDGAAYVKVLKAAYNAVKRVNPDAYVIGAAAAGDANCLEFLKDVFDNGGAEYMDAVSLHPYVWEQIPADESDVAFTQMDNIEALMGDKKVPIWITEVGYANADEGVKNAISEEEQGIFNVRTAVNYSADSRVERLFFYEFMNKGSDTSALTYNYGMITYDGEPKKSYDMLSCLNRLISGTEFYEKRTEQGDNHAGYSIYRFEGQDKNVFVMWANGGNEYDVSLSAEDSVLTAAASDGNLSIDLSADNRDRKILVYDAYGIQEDTSAIHLDYMPKYIVCESEAPGAEEYMPECSISVNYNSVAVKGTTAWKNSFVTLYAVNSGNNDTAYIDQCISDNDGGYSFDFEIGKNGFYAVYINDSTEKRMLNINICDAKCTLFKNGVITDDLSEAAAGDTITAKIEFEENAPECSLFGAVFDENSRVTRVFKTDISAETTEPVEMTLNVEADNESIRFFLWDRDMVPVINDRRIN